jgi:hypothetical protein
MWNKEIGLRYREQYELVSLIEQVCINGISPYYETIKLAQKTVVEIYSKEKNSQNILEVYNKLLIK